MVDLSIAMLVHQRVIIIDRHVMSETLKDRFVAIYRPHGLTKIGVYTLWISMVRKAITHR